MNPYRSWGLWLAKWSFFLLLAYFMTRATMSGINHWALAAVRAEMAENVYWAQAPHDKETRAVPTMKNLLTTSKLTPEAVEILNAADVGAKDWSELPQALKGPEGDKQVPGYWARDDAQTELLFKKLFVDKAEDKFDEFYRQSLLIPLQPIEREKHLRENVHYSDVITKPGNREQDREQLLRHFGNVYGECMRLFPCRVIRWVNGWVQVTAFAAFWLACLLLVHQYLTRVVWERWRAARFFPFVPKLANGAELQWATAPDPQWTPDAKSEGGWLTDERVTEELKKLNDPALGENPGVAVLMLREAYETYSRGSLDEHNARDRKGAAEAVEEVAAHEHKRIESDMAALVYLGWSLPTLGFIGTVLGLGMALLTAGDMVTPVSELQRDAIQSVSIYLGRAFDKTFVALLLSLVVMAPIYGIRRAQESVVLTFQERITRGVVRRLLG